MANKNNQNSNIPNASAMPNEVYIAWGEDLESKQQALKASADSLE